MTTYEPVIGLEVHVELNTQSKMFCRCSADYFGKAPNTHTCPVCLGLPGALPYINEKAIESCIKIGLALNCQIVDQSLFERKNYFYPDLPKGYQVSQYRWPLCIGGFIEVTNSLGEIKKIRINRAHQEEDTGKLTHLGNETLIDFNRSSVPLVEVVTEPDFHDTEEVRDYAKKLQQIFRYLGVSNADMEKGDMRLEANVSVRVKGETKLPSYRVELKNINSFRFMVAAIEYEIKRQIEAIENNEKLIQETRGWDEDKKKTYTQRVKEEANDYRYFPDPDLPALSIDQEKVERIKSQLPELPHQRIVRYQKEFGISSSAAAILSENRQLGEFFEQVVLDAKANGIEAKDVANYLVNKKTDLVDMNSSQIIDEIKSKRSGIIGDEKELEKVAKEVLAENPETVELYKKGKLSVIQSLIGLVMRKTAGKADVGKLKAILEDLLK